METRRARHRLAALVAVGALASIAATCQAAKPPAPPPPPPSVYCAPSPPDTADEYQAAFNGLRAANTAGWVASDGGLPVPLTDGRVVWLFGDTIIGAPANGPVNILEIRNNGFVVQNQNKNCFTPTTTEPIPDPGTNQWIWPTGAVQPNASTLLVFGLHMRRGGAPPFEFELQSIDVARFSLSNLNAPVSVTDLPLPHSPTYGETLLVDGNFVYAYGQTREATGIPNTFPVPKHYVARAQLGSVVDGPWRFWSGIPGLEDEGWVTNPGLAAPMLFERPDDAIPGPSPVEGPLAGFAVGQNGSYVGSSFMIDAFSNDMIWTWDSAEPQGPWTRGVAPAIDIRDTHGPITLPERFAYGGRVVFNVQGSPLGLWSTNHESLDAIRQNPAFYKVWFATPAAG